MSKFPEIMKNRTASGWTDSLKEIDSAGEKNDEYTVKNGLILISCLAARQGDTAIPGRNKAHS
jgi:hypothetical protein